MDGDASAPSVKAGETVKFHVSTRPAKRWILEIYRMGWYGETEPGWSSGWGRLRALSNPRLR